METRFNSRCYKLRGNYRLCSAAGSILVLIHFDLRDIFKSVFWFWTIFGKPAFYFQHYILPLAMN